MLKPWQNKHIYQFVRVVLLILLFFESFSADPMYLQNAYQIEAEEMRFVEWYAPLVSTHSTLNAVRCFVDQNGNLKSKVTPSGQTTYTYDPQNRLSTVTTPQHQIDYEYDPHGNRIAEVLDGARTKFMVDSSRAYAQVIEERQSGALTKRYVFGNDLISWTEGGKSYYPMSDHLQSVRALTDASGQIVGTNTFDAYGSNIKTTGDITSRHQFTGERFSPETGLLHLRAREYDPSVGRFTSRDPFPGFSQDPQTLHKYIYASNDPVNRVDRSGEFSMMESISVVNIMNKISMMYIYNILFSTLAQLKEVGYRNESVSRINNEPIVKENATITIHGVNGSPFMITHPPGWADDFHFAIQQAGGKDKDDMNQDFHEYVWSGFFGFSGVGFLGFVPRRTVHHIATEGFAHALTLLFTKDYINTNIISHSWGTIISLDAIKRVGLPIDNWITMGTVLHKKTKHPGNVKDWTNIYALDDNVMNYVVWDGTGEWSITKYGYHSSNAFKCQGDSDYEALGIGSGGHTGYWENDKVLKQIREELDNAS